MKKYADTRTGYVEGWSMSKEIDYPRGAVETSEEDVEILAELPREPLPMPLALSNQRPPPAIRKDNNNHYCKF